MAEAEFENLIKLIRFSNQTDEEFKPMYTFLSRMIQQDQKVKITPFIKQNLSYLSTADKGLIWPLALRVMEGYKPEMIVPPLGMNTKSPRLKLPPKLTMSARAPNLPTSLQLPIYVHNRTVKYVSIVTTRDIMPKLAVAPPGEFFYCNHKNKPDRNQPSALSYKIHRKKVPPIPLTPDQRTITANGLYYISSDCTGEFMEMDDFLTDKEKIYMASILPVFQNWYVNKSFIKWFYRLRMKRHKRTESIVLNNCPFGHNEFFDFIFEIRQTVFDTFTQCHPVDQDQPLDTFELLYENSMNSIHLMQEKIEKLDTNLCEKISHFIIQVRGISLLLRSDYSVLKTIGSLPKSLIPYAVEHDVNAPSLKMAQIRNKILFNERKRAYDRKEYLPNFFIMVKLFMRDFFVQQLKSTLHEFYFRFTEQPPTKSHCIVLALDRDSGLVLIPTHQEFLDWVNRVDRMIKAIFLADNLQLDEETMELIFPEKNCPTVKMIEEVAISPDMIEMKEAAIKMIDDAYGVFEKKMQPSCIFLKKMLDRLNEISQYEEYETSEQYVAIAKEITDLLGEIDNLQRISTYGSLFSDMKPGKTKAIELLRATIDKTLYIGLVRAQELFDNIIVNKNLYIKKLHINKMIPPTEEALEEQKKIAENLLKETNDFISIAQSIIEHWNDSSQEVQEQLVSVKEVLALVESTTKPKKHSKRKRVKPKK